MVVKMEKVLNKLFVIVYSVVSKKDEDDSVIKVTLYLSMCLTWFLVSINFLHQFLTIKRDFRFFIIIGLVFILVGIILVKYYFYNDRHKILIRIYENTDIGTRNKYKVITIIIFIIIQLGGMAAAQYAYLNS
jgi:hypothetical protein